MVRSLATPLEGRGSPKKFSRTGVRTPKRTNQSGAGFGNPAPDLETCVSLQPMVRMTKFKLSRARLVASPSHTEFRTILRGVVF